MLMLEEVSTGPRPDGPNGHKLPNGTGMASMHAIVQIKNSSYVIVYLQWGMFDVTVSVGYSPPEPPNFMRSHFLSYP
jgi:hypothetical protein